MNTAQNVKGFDISSLELDKPVTFNVPLILDEEGEPVSGFILVGKNSPEFQTANNALRIANIMRNSKRAKQIDSSTEEGAKQLAKLVSDGEKAVTMACIVGWFGFDLENSPMNFDKNIVEKMVTKYPQWLVQSTQALDNDSNFMKI